MKRAVVIGPGGSGKSQLARQISDRAGLPVVHLDPLFWRGTWDPVPEPDARRALANAVAGNKWVLDGNFLDLAGDDVRFARADTVIFLDLPRLTCVRRVLWRLIRDRRRYRPDLPRGGKESFDISLLRWIWHYAKTDRPRVLKILACLDPRIDVQHLHSRSDVRHYLETVNAGPAE